MKLWQKILIGLVLIFGLVLIGWSIRHPPLQSINIPTDISCKSFGLDLKERKTSLMNQVNLCTGLCEDIGKSYAGSKCPLLKDYITYFGKEPRFQKNKIFCICFIPEKTGLEKLKERLNS